MGGIGEFPANQCRTGAWDAGHKAVRRVGRQDPNVPNPRPLASQGRIQEGSLVGVGG